MNSTDQNYKLTFFSIIKYSKSTFVTTLTTEQNEKLYKKNQKTVFTLLFLLICAVIGLIWARQLDIKDVEIKSTGKVPFCVSGLRRHNFIFRNAKIKLNTCTAKKLEFEDSLPSILKTKPMFDRIFEEIKAHHKWFAVKYYFSDRFPRPLRVLSLISNVIVFMFIQSITYNLTNPDDGSCNELNTEVKCLVPKSPYGTGGSKCIWVSDKSCEFNPPANSAQIVLFVALFSALIGAPIIVFISWIIHNILCASSTKSPNNGLMLSMSKKHPVKDSHHFFIAALKEMSQLLEEIKKFREKLAQSDRIEFDGT
jgi:hypothetical protein